MISYLSELFTLQAGDIILTGTPSGGRTGPARQHDARATSDCVGDLNVSVV